MWKWDIEGLDFVGKLTISSCVGISRRVTWCKAPEVIDAAADWMLPGTGTELACSSFCSLQTALLEVTCRLFWPAAVRAGIVSTDVVHGGLRRFRLFAAVAFGTVGSAACRQGAEGARLGSVNCRPAGAARVSAARSAAT